MAVGLLLPGLAQAQKAKPVEPLNGKDLTGWKTREPDKNQWVVGKAVLSADDPKELKVEEGGNALINAKGHGTDIYTEATFGDCLVEVEVMVPQESNSGVYLMGEYEVQVLDSYGKKEIGQGDMGSIYSAATATSNASKPAGEWQKFVLDFRAPKFAADGKKTANARFVRITLNDQVIHENVEVQKSTGGGITGREHPTGPLMFQGNHGSVAYRNIKITPVN
jgi:hypothetical protein